MDTDDLAKRKDASAFPPCAPDERSPAARSDRMIWGRMGGWGEGGGGGGRTDEEEGRLQLFIGAVCEWNTRRACLSLLFGWSALQLEE